MQSMKSYRRALIGRVLAERDYIEGPARSVQLVDQVPDRCVVAGRSKVEQRATLRMGPELRERVKIADLRGTATSGASD